MTLRKKAETFFTISILIMSVIFFLSLFFTHELLKEFLANHLYLVAGIIVYVVIGTNIFYVKKPNNISDDDDMEDYNNRDFSDMEIALGGGIDSSGYWTMYD